MRIAGFGSLIATMALAAAPGGASAPAWSLAQEVAYLEKLSKTAWYYSSLDALGLLAGLSKEKGFSGIRIPNDFALIVQADYENGIQTVIILERSGADYRLRGLLTPTRAEVFENGVRVPFTCIASSQYQPIPRDQDPELPLLPLHSTASYLACSKAGKIYRYGGTAQTDFKWTGPASMNGIYRKLFPEWQARPTHPANGSRDSKPPARP